MPQPIKKPTIRNIVSLKPQCLGTNARNLPTRGINSKPPMILSLSDLGSACLAALALASLVCSVFVPLFGSLSLMATQRGVKNNCHRDDEVFLLNSSCDRRGENSPAKQFRCWLLYSLRKTKSNLFG